MFQIMLTDWVGMAGLVTMVAYGALVISVLPFSLKWNRRPDDPI